MRLFSHCSTSAMTIAKACLVFSCLVSTASPAAEAGLDRSDLAERLSSQPIAESREWRDLMVAAKGDFVNPVRVKVKGDDAETTNPNGLRQKGGGVATLTTSDRHSTSFVIDLGRVTMGYVEVGISSAEGAPVRLSYAQFGQFLGSDGDGMNLSSSFGTDDDPEARVDVFEPPDEPTVLRSPGKREVRYIAVTLDAPGTVAIDFVRVDKAIFPVTYDGYFLSSDETLNRAWYASAHTGDLATVKQDGSPWMLLVTFDRILFMADLHMQALAGYYQSSDYRMLMRNTLNQFGCIQNPDGSLPLASSPLVKCKVGDPGPPDGWRSPEEGPDPHVALGSTGNGLSLIDDIPIDSFTAFWVVSLADYYLYTGDADFVQPLMPVARRAVGFLSERTTKDGLYYEPHDDFAMRSNWQPGDIATGVDSYSNAVFVAALRGLAMLESEVGQANAAGTLLEQASRVRKALITHLWDSETGAMILNDEDSLRDHTGDANAGNLMFEVLDPERASSTMDFLETTLGTPYGTRLSEFHNNPYRQSYIHGYMQSVEALGRMRYGDGHGAVDLIRRAWGHMLEIGPGTGWFTMNNDGSVEPGFFANSSWTTAIPALSEGVLGVRPLAAGYEQWIVSPQVSGLDWAQGKVPVPDGAISVRWRQNDNGFVLTIESPAEGKEGTVVVPFLGEAREIAMDGNVVWTPKSGAADGVDASVGEAAVSFTGIRGHHTFAWARY